VAHGPLPGKIPVMVKAGLCACLVLLASACGGKSGKSSEDVSGASGAAGASGLAAPTCADTPRSQGDDAANAAVVDMAAHAEPEKLVPLLISLVEVPVSPGVSPSARAEELEPYQGPVAAKLAEWGAEGIERFWLVNAIAASVPAKYVAKVLCLANVRRLESDAAYWDIVDAPWGPDEAGKLECPLVGDECPEHCFDLNGVPWQAATACYGGRERVACTKYQSGITDGAASCFEHVASGRTYLFYSFVPIEPNFLGWRPCGAEREVTTCTQ
jgi:hypothetical protein